MSTKRKSNTSDNLLQSLDVRREYKKPNFLISSKYESTLLENQIQAYSLSHIDHFKFDEKNHVLVDEMKASDLRQLLGGNNGSFYRTLLKVSNRLTKRNIGFIDPESKTFRFMTVIIDAAYKKGKFTISYNPYLTDYIQDIKNKYTKLSLKVMMEFTNVNSFRLYEIVKSQCYDINLLKGFENRYCFRISLAELKLELGLVKIDDNTDISDNLVGSKTPDYELAIEKAESKKLQKWGEFERSAFKPAVEEINSIDSGIHIEYDTVKGGRGGKVIGIIFTVDDYSNTSQTEHVELTENEKLDRMFEIKALLGQDFSANDIRPIAEAANYDITKVSFANNLLKMNKSKVDNPTGWLIAAIQKNFTNAEPVYPNKFDFMDSGTNYADMESQLVENM